MSGFFKQFTNINSEVYRVDWLVYLNYLSSFTTARLKCCFLQVQQISSLPENPSFLFRQNCFERKFKNRTEMVGTKHRTVQWSGINSTVCRSFNTDRCLIKGLQGNFQWNINRGYMVCSGNEKPHKCLRTFSHKTG